MCGTSEINVVLFSEQLSGYCNLQRGGGFFSWGFQSGAQLLKALALHYPEDFALRPSANENPKAMHFLEAEHPVVGLPVFRWLTFWSLLRLWS